MFNTGWRVWVPPSAPGHVANNLRVIRGGGAYLIHVSQGTTLKVTGQPTGATTRWRHGFTLNGFHVVDDAAITPTFEAYLNASSAFDGTQVFQV